MPINSPESILYLQVTTVSLLALDSLFISVCPPRSVTTPTFSLGRPGGLTTPTSSSEVQNLLLLLFRALRETVPNLTLNTTQQKSCFMFELDVQFLYLEKSGQVYQKIFLHEVHNVKGEVKTQNFQLFKTLSEIQLVTQIQFIQGCPKARGSPVCGSATLLTHIQRDTNREVEQAL